MSMDSRTAFLIQVLEKIGTPLAAAVTALPPGQAGATADAIVRQDAQRVAELLNRSVQLGLTVADGMNVRDAAQADGVHLSLAAFASPLIASLFMTGGGKVPGDAEIRRLSSSLQAVLTFADNFTPAADSTLRLENMAPGQTPADEHLVYVQMLQAFSPVLQVIGEYAFGKPENRLLQDVASRLMIRAEDLRKAMFGPGLPPKTARQADLVLLNMLTALYATSHRAEMLRLMALDDKARAAAVVSIDTVWTLFDQRVEMVRVLAAQIVPDKAGNAASGSGGGPVPDKESVLDQHVKPVPVPATPPAKEGGAGNPMAFFAPKKAESGGN
ncbi:MAG: hypothetical protein HYU57_08285 [Micavibrio aeruginosavorus]|nr:hypothetical protein [Micavibrio aeruginosavorus]